MKVPGFIFFFTTISAVAVAQTLQPSPNPSGSPALDEETIVPTFETQKLARTYVLDVPAPRGQITDRNGAPLAQNKLSYNLAINFPTPLDFSDAQAISFAREKIDRAERLTGRPIKISNEAILRHYRNRGILPFEIAQNLSQSEYDAVKDHSTGSMTVRPIYVRTYPNGKLAGQIIGYTGKTGRNLDSIIDNHETFWPETEGREGLEQTFNQLLAGKHGEYKLTFDKDGRKTSEKLITPPVPGSNIVTTLDLRLQELAEKALEAKAKRGAIVIVDPNNGDILAMASWPTYDPNLFVPAISAEKFKRLQDDPDVLVAIGAKLAVEAQCVVGRRGVLHVDPDEVAARRGICDDGFEIRAAHVVTEVQPEPSQLHAHVRVESASLDVGKNVLIRAHDRGRFVLVLDLLAEDVDRRHLPLRVQLPDGLAGVLQLRPGDVPLRELLHDRARNRRKQAHDRAVEDRHLSSARA